MSNLQNAVQQSANEYGLSNVVGRDQKPGDEVAIDRVSAAFLADSDRERLMVAQTRMSTKVQMLEAFIVEQASRIAELEALINSPELHDFSKGVTLEAAHQRERWATDHDDGKAPADWFWLIGYLAQKAMMSQIAGDKDKALHHTITTAAAMGNWHAAILGKTDMRPGIAAPQGETK